MPPKKAFKQKTEQEKKKTRILPNRDLQLSEKVLVRLDSRTQVYASVPYDIDYLKKKFIKPLKKF